MFATLRRVPVRRRRDDRWVAGAAGGLADRLGVDAALVRAGVVVLALLGGVGAVLYGLAWLLVPEEPVTTPPDDRSADPAGAAASGGPGRLEVEELVHGEVSASAVIALALVVLGSLLPGPWSWWAGPAWSGFPWGVVITVGLLVGLVAWARAAAAGSAGGRGGDQPVSPQAPRPGSGPAPTATAPRAGTDAGTRSVRPRHRTAGAAATSVLLGLALLAAGAVALVVWQGDLDLGVGAGTGALGAAAAVLSVATLLLGLAGRDSGAVGGFGGLVVVVLAAAVLVPPGARLTWLGDRTWSPSSTAAAERGAATFAGSTTVDLRGLRAELGASSTPDDAVVVPLRQAVGELQVLVPDDVDVVVDVSQVLGAVRTDLPAGWTVDGQRDVEDDDGGVGRSAELASPGARTGGADLLVDVGAGIGDVRVQALP